MWNLNFCTLRIVGRFSSYRNYKQPTAYINISLNGETLNVFPLRAGPRQERPLSSVLLNIIMEGVATTIRLKKRHKYKKKMELFLFTKEFVHIENHRKCPKELLE